MDARRRWRVATSGIVKTIRVHRLELAAEALEVRAGLERGTVGAVEAGERDLSAWEAYAIERVAGMEMGAIARMAEPMVTGLGVAGEGEKAAAEVWWERMGRIETLEELLAGLEAALAEGPPSDGRPVSVRVGGEAVAITWGLVELYRELGPKVKEARDVYLRLLRQAAGSVVPDTEEPRGGDSADAPASSRRGMPDSKL